MWAWMLTLASAQAAGFGSSVGISTRGGPGFFWPSFDVHADPVVIQIHGLEFLDSLTTNDVYFGGNLYFDAARNDFREAFDGVVQPGLSLDFQADPATLVLLVECRVGFEHDTSNGGFGVYAVPALGVGVGEPQTIAGVGDDGPFIVGGALQISAWLGNARRE